jgi:hypothetical protein
MGFDKKNRGKVYGVAEQAFYSQTRTALCYDSTWLSEVSNGQLL